MKMIYTAATSILDYPKYVYNYTLGQYNYKIPIGSSGDVYLYIPLAEFGVPVPGSFGIELVHTCGPNIGTVEVMTAANYVGGLDTNNRPYITIIGLVELTTAPCFVVAVNIGGLLWFSQEYTLDGCETGLSYVESCYGNLDPKISYDREGIYFGQSQGGTVGDAALVYPHKFGMRKIDVTISAIRNEFKEGRVRNFRTESTDILQFWGDLIPEWYLKHIDAVFKRGELHIDHNNFKSFAETDAGGAPVYLVENTAYEKADECIKGWKPTVFLKEGFYNSFSCEPDPCTIVTAGGGGGTPLCCDPTIISAIVTPVEGSLQVCVSFNPCEPAPANGYFLYYRIAGSGGAFTAASDYGSSPACFNTEDPEGTQYEGYIYSDCGGGIVGNNVTWSTGGPATTVSINLATPCAGSSQFSDYIITGTPGDTITVTVFYGGIMQRQLPGLFVRANLEITSPCTPGIVFSSCEVDTNNHFFTLSSTCTFVLDGTGTEHVTTLAWVDNSSESGTSSYAQVTDVNGDVHTESASGCRGNSGTGGNCP